MKAEEVSPGEISFPVLLCACIHIGSVDEGVGLGQLNKQILLDQ